MTMYIETDDRWEECTVEVKNKNGTTDFICDIYDVYMNGNVLNFPKGRITAFGCSAYAVGMVNSRKVLMVSP